MGQNDSQDNKYRNRATERTKRDTQVKGHADRKKKKRQTGQKIFRQENKERRNIAKIQHVKAKIRTKRSTDNMTDRTR